MRKIDRILREVLHRFYEGGERFFNQKGLAQTCGSPWGTVNPVIARLEQLGAIERRPLGFRLIDPKRALVYWAVTRELAKDTYTTFVPVKPEELEADMPRRRCSHRLLGLPPEAGSCAHRLRARIRLRRCGRGEARVQADLPGKTEPVRAHPR